MGEEEEGVVVVGSEGLVVYAPFHVAGGVDDFVYEESDRRGWFCGRGYGVVGYCLGQGILSRRNFSMLSLWCSPRKTHVAACTSIVIVPRLGRWLICNVGVIVENLSQGLIGRLNGQRADYRDV